MHTHHHGNVLIITGFRTCLVQAKGGDCESEGKEDEVDRATGSGGAVKLPWNLRTLGCSQHEGERIISFLMQILGFLKARSLQMCLIRTTWTKVTVQHNLDSRYISQFQSQSGEYPPSFPRIYIYIYHEHLLSRISSLNPASLQISA